MSDRTPRALMLAIAFSIPLALFSGCSREVEHSESDKPGWFGSRTQQETTVYRNPDGTTSSSYEKKTTNP